MPRIAKYTPAQKAKLLKEVKGLPTKEAAARLEISPVTYSKWVAAAKKSKIKAPVIEGSKNIIAPTAKSKINMKKVIKAISAIEASLAILQSYVNVSVAA